MSLLLLIGINQVGTRIAGNTAKPLIRLSMMGSGTLNIYRDLLTSLSVMTLGASMCDILGASNRRNVRRDITNWKRVQMFPSRTEERLLIFAQNA